jgi:hypothetical protein
MESLIIICAVVAVAALVVGRLAMPRTIQGARTNDPQVRPQADPLLAACFGDAAKAQRLTEYERKRHPYLSIEQARQAAYDRLMHDRQR